MENIADRINLLIKNLQVSKNGFAEIIGISSSLISQITTKKNNFRADILQRITSAYPNVNPAWLLNGIGEMWLNEPHPIINKSNEKEIVNKSYVDNDAPLYLERHAQKKIALEFMKGSNNRDKIYQNINTLLCFQYIISNLDHHYFESIDKKQHDVSTYYDGKTFDFEKYREDIIAELDKVKEFSAALNNIAISIEKFYQDIKPIDKKNIVSGFFTGEYNTK